MWPMCSVAPVCHGGPANPDCQAIAHIRLGRESTNRQALSTSWFRVCLLQGLFSGPFAPAFAHAPQSERGAARAQGGQELPPTRLRLPEDALEMAARAVLCGIPGEIDVVAHGSSSSCRRHSFGARVAAGQCNRPPAAARPGSGALTPRVDARQGSLDL